MRTNDMGASSISGAELYHEVCGAGPVVLLIGATPGDADQFTALGSELAKHHTIITYDRRGTSRSGQPAGWVETSVQEQADDAAALLASVTSEPAIVYGTSNGAAIALELALRHPNRMSTAILHEMPLLSVIADPAPVGQMIGELIGGAMERGGPAAALDAFLRFAYGDDVVNNLPTGMRARLDANAEMVFTIEMPAFQAYRPDEAALAGIHVPVVVLVGEDQPVPFFREAAEWLAGHTGTTVELSPGAHGPHFTDTSALASLITAHDPTG